MTTQRPQATGARRPNHADAYANRVSIEQILARGAGDAIFRADNPLRLRMGYDTKALLRTALTHLLQQKGSAPLTWLAQYDEVADWLTDNQGRGLLLYGGCGQGKTLLAKWIIPLIYLKIHQKIFHVHDARELNEQLPAILNETLVVIDDVGTEPISQFRSVAFCDVLDEAEKRGRIVIVTTNLDANALQERYGVRALDRLRAITRRIYFDGQSLRH